MKTNDACAFAATAGLALACAPALEAGHVSPIPVGDAFAGTTYGELVVPWWDWATNTGPLGDNAIQDPTGARGGVNQGLHNPDIFWLAGSFGIPEGPRCVTVPYGRYLFMPVVNTIWWAPEDGPDIPSLEVLAADAVNTLADDPDSFFQVSVDGEVVASDADLRSSYRVNGDGILTFDPANMSGAFVPTFEDRVAVADGMWLALEPLSPGEHTVNITAQSPANEFNLVVDYKLKVPDGGATGLLGLIALTALAGLRRLAGSS